MIKSRLQSLGMRTMIVVLVAVIAIGGTFSAFSYWDNLEKSRSKLVTIGESLSVIVTEEVTIPEGVTLIPAGHILGPYDLDSLEMSYLVSISGQTVLPQEILLSIENVLIGGQVANTELISFTITSNRYINFGTPEMVIITISLLEPENLEIFNEIVHHEITYDVVFTIRDMDVIPPTFDPIINQSIEAGSEDIDWSTYIVNPDDNRDVYGD